jgi:hypothetical protein
MYSGQLLVYTPAVINCDQVNDMLLFIQLEDEPVPLCNPCGLLTLKGTGKPSPTIHGIFTKPLYLFAEFVNDSLISPELRKSLKKRIGPLDRPDNQLN